MLECAPFGNRQERFPRPRDRNGVNCGNPLPRFGVIEQKLHALILVLDDAGKSHDVYQEHPLHKEFIARHKANWKKVQIFDSNG